MSSVRAGTTSTGASELVDGGNGKGRSKLAIPQSNRCRFSRIPCRSATNPIAKFLHVPTPRRHRRREASRLPRQSDTIRQGSAIPSAAQNFFLKVWVSEETRSPRHAEPRMPQDPETSTKFSLKCCSNMNLKIRSFPERREPFRCPQTPICDCSKSRCSGCQGEF